MFKTIVFCYDKIRSKKQSNTYRYVNDISIVIEADVEFKNLLPPVAFTNPRDRLVLLISNSKFDHLFFSGIVPVLFTINTKQHKMLESKIFPMKGYHLFGRNKRLNNLLIATFSEFPILAKKSETDKKDVFNFYTSFYVSIVPLTDNKGSKKDDILFHLANENRY